MSPQQQLLAADPAKIVKIVQIHKQTELFLNKQTKYRVEWAISCYFTSGE